MAIAFSNDGERLAFGDQNGNASIMDLTTGQRAKNATGDSIGLKHDDWVRAVAWSADDSVRSAGAHHPLNPWGGACTMPAVRPDAKPATRPLVLVTSWPSATIDLALTAHRLTIASVAVAVGGKRRR